MYGCSCDRVRERVAREPESHMRGTLRVRSMGIHGAKNRYGPTGDCVDDKSPRVTLLNSFAYCTIVFLARIVLYCDSKSELFLW